MSWKCAKCGKSVYHAEHMMDHGLDFHNTCFQLYVKEKKAEEAAKRNKDYLKQADVTPAYYRVSDPASGTPARMVTGPDERTGQVGVPAPTTNSYNCPACHASVPCAAKFCPECGAKNEPIAPAAPAKPASCPKCGTPASGGKFCQECGTPMQ